MKLFKKRMRLPNGFVVELDVVGHLGAVLIIPFLSKDKVIMLKQFRPVINTYLFELPAGTLKENESLLSCARREIVEEAGYSAKVFNRLGQIYPVPGYSTEKIVIFKAQGLERELKRNLEKDEVIQVKVVSKKELMSLFKKGRIVDAKTICAFAMCGWLG